MRPSLQLAVLIGMAFSGAITAAWLAYRSKKDPTDAERRRRSLIAEQGRLLEGFVTDVADGVVYYTYSWRGVDYEASQDIGRIPGGASISPDVIGPVTIKFLPQNPVNSIVHSETWSGFPGRRLPPTNTKVV